MEYTMTPTIVIRDLVEELRLQYDIQVTEQELCAYLWGDGAIDADYKLYYYGDGPDAGETTIEKCVITLFEDMFPDWNDILVILSYF